MTGDVLSGDEAFAHQLADALFDGGDTSGVVGSLAVPEPDVIRVSPDDVLGAFEDCHQGSGFIETDCQAISPDGLHKCFDDDDETHMDDHWCCCEVRWPLDDDDPRRVKYVTREEGLGPEPTITVNSWSYSYGVYDLGDELNEESWLGETVTGVYVDEMADVSYQDWDKMMARLGNLRTPESDAPPSSGHDPDVLRAIMGTEDPALKRALLEEYHREDR